MTRIAFIQSMFRTQQGIMQLSAVLKKHNHETDVFINKDASDETLNEILRFKPDIVGFSTATPNQKCDLELASKIKNTDKEIFIIMGGPHPTFYNQVLDENNQLDAICIGEGEYALLDLADNFWDKEQIKNIKNLWVRCGDKIIKNDVRNLINNLDELDMPDFEIYYDKFPSLAKSNTKIFMVGRGCPYPCAYCFNKRMMEIYHNKGQYVRNKSADRIIREILYVKFKYGIKWVQFNDDTFGIDRKWLKEFLTEYKEKVGIPFLCNVRANLVDDEMIRELKEAGVDRIDFGVEVGNEKFRKEILNRNITNEQMINAAKHMKKYRIRFHTANIVGFPMETLEQAFETVKLNQEIKPNKSDCAVLQPFPGTDIYEYAKRNNLLKENISIDDFGPQRAWTSGAKEVHSLIVQDNMEKLINLSYLFEILVEHPRLEWLVRILIKLKPNRFFVVASQWGFFKLYFKYANGYRERMSLLWRFLKPLI